MKKTYNLNNVNTLNFRKIRNLNANHPKDYPIYPTISLPQTKRALPQAGEPFSNQAIERLIQQLINPSNTLTTTNTSSHHTVFITTAAHFVE